MAPGYKAARDDGVSRLHAVCLKVMDRLKRKEYEKEPIQKLSLACVVQRCIYFRLASHSGPLLPKKKERIQTFPFLKSSPVG